MPYRYLTRSLGSAGLSYTLGRFYGQFRVNFTGRRQTSAAANGWPNFDGERLMCDLSASYRLSRHATLFLNGKNVIPSQRKM